MRNNAFILIAIFFGWLSSDLSAQVSFTKGAIIKKSYASSTMIASPVLGKSDNGFFILSGGLMSAKRIVQLNLDEQMNQLGEEVVVKLPKGKALRKIFNIDNAMIVILRSGKKADPFECYNYDFTNSKLGELLLSIPVDDYPGREELEISELNDDFQDYLGFIVRPKVEYSHVYRKVVVADRKLNKIVWSQIIEDPYVESRESLGQFELSDLYFNDAFTVVSRFTRSFLAEEKEEILTDMFHFNGSKTENTWHDQVIRSTTKEELLSLPLPYLSKNNKVEVYNLFCDKKRNSFDLVKFDIRGDEIERFQLSSNLDGLSTIKRVGIYDCVLPVNDGFEKGSFCILLSEQLSQADLFYGNEPLGAKFFTATFNIDESGITQDKIIDVGWPDAFAEEIGGRIILSNSMDAIVKGELVASKQQEVFDNYQIESKKTQSGVTYHYVVEGELYSIHSEYGTRDMSSQLVKWSFN